MEILDDGAILLKSTQDNYFDEMNGEKPNTYREIPRDEFETQQLSYDSELKRFYAMGHGVVETVVIMNTCSEMCFERSITDVRPFNVKENEIWIISWNHEEKTNDDMIYLMRNVSSRIQSYMS
jgi:hypothetical protein